MQKLTIFSAAVIAAAYAVGVETEAEANDWRAPYLERL